MNGSIFDYYQSALHELHFTEIPEKSSKYETYFRMISEFGRGKIRKIQVKSLFLILIADYTPNDALEKVSTVAQEYVEISQFETNTSYFKVGGKRIKQVEQGICCYVNHSKTVFVKCEAGQPVRFTKVILSKKYLDFFVKERFADEYDLSESTFEFLVQNTNIPGLNFVFQQIKDCQATGLAAQLYLESKIMEILSLVTYNKEQTQNKAITHIKIDKKDRKSLQKVVLYMKENMSAYPTVRELAKVSEMSLSRFQAAFKFVYGSTVYEYFKDMKMNYALFLLQNSDDSIQTVAKKIGYNNAGHFAGIFKKTYGMGPKEYRNIHRLR